MDFSLLSLWLYSGSPLHQHSNLISQSSPALIQRRVQIHSLPLHLNSFHSRHIHHQYQPPPPDRPLPTSLRPGILKSDEPLEALVSTPTDTITLVKVPLPTCHSIGVPHFDPANVKSLAKYFEDFELLVTRVQLSDAEKVKYAHQYALRQEGEFWTSLPEFRRFRQIGRHTNMQFLMLILAQHWTNGGHQTSLTTSVPHWQASRSLQLWALQLSTGRSQQPVIHGSSQIVWMSSNFGIVT